MFLVHSHKNNIGILFNDKKRLSGGLLGKRLDLLIFNLMLIELMKQNKNQTRRAKQEETNKKRQTRRDKQEETNKKRQTRRDKQEETNKKRQTRRDKQEETNKKRQTRRDKQEETNKKRQKKQINEIQMFATNLLKAEPWRYACIIEAVLPALVIGAGATWFSPTSQTAKNVKGRPPGWAFGVIWLVLIIVWTLALILSAMNMRKNMALLGLIIFSLLSLIMCFAWLILNKKDLKIMAYFSILAAMACMFIATLCAATSESQNVNAKTFSTVSFGVVGLWLFVASNLSLTELNKL